MLKVVYDQYLFLDQSLPKIVIIGNVQSGKSTLANLLSTGNVYQKCEEPMCQFPVCNSINLCTKTTTFKEGKWLGTGDDIIVVDTPGFSYIDEHLFEQNDQFIEQMIKILHDDIKIANAVILAVNGKDMSRTMPLGMVQMLKSLERSFGQDLWKNLIISITNWSYAEDEVLERRRNGQTDAEIKTNWNVELKEKLNISHDTPFTFIDAYSQLDWNKKNKNLDPLRHEKFEKGTSELLAFIRNSEEFSFKNAKELKREKRELNHQVELLNDVITTNTADMNAKFENINQKLVKFIK